MSDQNSLSTPGFFRRLIVLFYDSFLVFTLAMCCSALIIALRVAIEGPNAIADGEMAISGAWRLPTFLLIIFVTCHFYVIFWLKGGQTLGMQTWKIRLDNKNNERISPKQAYIRFAAAFLSLICFGLGFIWVLFDKDKLSWHDRLSCTHLVLLPKR